MKLKNILTFAMSLALVVLVMTTNISKIDNPIVASAEYNYNDWDMDNQYVTDEGFIYTISKNNDEITLNDIYPTINNIVGDFKESNWWYYSNVTNIVIPSKINNKPVTNISGFYGDLQYPSIGKIDQNGCIIYDEHNWFGINYPYVETIQIPESVKYINSYSFNESTFSYNENGHIKPNLKEVTILSKDVEIEDGFLCSWNNEPMTDVTLIGYVGSTTEEYAKKYGFNFVDITTIQKDDDTSKDNDTNKDNTKNPTIGDSKKNTIGDSGKTNDTGKTNNSTTDKTSSTTVKTSSPATSDNGVMPLIGLGAIVGVGALLSKKKIG